MKTAGLATIALVVIYAFLFLIELWFKIFSPAVFMKTSITFGVLIVVLGLVSIIRKEYVQEEKQKKDGYIDS